MKEAIILVVLLVFSMSDTGFVYADSLADANANAGANAVVNNNPTVNSTVGSSSTSGVTLDSGAVANTAVTGGSSAQNGDQIVNVEGTNLTFEAAKIPPPAAFVPQVSGSTPQIFGPLNGTANETGIEFTLFYDQVCPSKAIRGLDLTDKVYGGASRKTEIIFSPHSNYAQEEKKLSPNMRGQPAKKDKVNEVEAVFDAKAKGFFTCLGIITITADQSKAGKVSLSTILSDAKAFPLRGMKGYSRVILLSSTATIAATKGVDNHGGGLGASAGASRFLDPVLGTLGGSIGTSSGATFPETKLGATFIVAVEDSNGVFIDLTPPPPLTPISDVAQTKAPATAESKPGGPQENVVIPITTPTTAPVAKAEEKPVVKPAPKKKRVATTATPPKTATETIIDCKKNTCVAVGSVKVTPK